MFRDELEKLKKEYIEVEKKVKEQDEIDEGIQVMCLQLQSNLRGEDTLGQWPLSFVQRLCSSRGLSLELPGESESRSWVWTRNTLCLPIFGLKPYVEKL